MTHPQDPRIPRTPGSLEPWQIELEAEARDRREHEELRAVVSLLRGLPDPEPPDDLVPRVLERIAAREARPSVVRATFRAARALVEPRAALALAAGVAGLLAFAALQGIPLSGFPGADEPASVRIALSGTQADETGTVADGAVPRVHRPAPARWPSATVVHPRFVSFLSSYPQAPTPQIRLGEPAGEGLARLDRHFDNHLDGQLNRLLLDPLAFCKRLEGVSRRDAVIARLADRAARRGDATDIAMRVRQIDHPIGRQIADRLLRAALVQYVSPR